MKSLVILAFLVGLSMARPLPRFVTKDLYSVQSPADAVQFLKGFAVGLETILGDPTLCAQDIQKMTTDFNSAFLHIGEGIKQKSIAKLKLGLQEFADGLQKASDAFKDCGIEQAAADIAEIVAEIKSGHVLAFIKHEIVHIWHHGRELIHLFKDMTATWKARQFYECGVDVGEIVAILLEGKNHPLDVKPADLANYVRGVAEGMGQSIGDPTACVHDIDVAIANFNAAWNDVKDGIRKISVKIIKRAIQEFADGLHSVADAFTKCGLEQAAALIEKIVKEIKAGKLLEVLAREAVHIFCHGKELIHLFKSASENWRGGNFLQSGRDTGKIIAFILDIPPA